MQESIIDNQVAEAYLFLLGALSAQLLCPLVEKSHGRALQLFFPPKLGRKNYIYKIRKGR